MSFRLIFISFFLFGTVFLTSVLAGDVDLSPPKLFGSANQTTGVFEHYELLENLRFDGGAQALPLRLFYSPEKREGHPYLGQDWTIPLFDSAATPTDTGLLKLKLLCGKTMHLTASPETPTKWFNYNGWTGRETRKGSSRVLKVSRADGWSVSFTDGLVSGATDDKGNQWRWDRDQKRRLTALRQIVPKDGPSCVLSYNEDETINDIRFGKSTYDFHYEQGLFERIDLDQRPLRTYRIDAEKGFFIVASAGKENRYDWNPESGLVTKDSGGVYNIKTRPGNRPIFEVTRRNGDVDLLDFDILTGIKTTRRHGISTRTHYHTQQGPLHYKIDEIWRKQGVDAEFQLAERYKYNAKGEIILSDISGTVTEWLEEKRGRVQKKLINGLVVHEEHFDEKDRLVYWHRKGETFRAKHEEDAVLLYPDGKRDAAVSLSAQKFKEFFLKQDSILR